MGLCSTEWESKFKFNRYISSYRCNVSSYNTLNTRFSGQRVTISCYTVCFTWHIIPCDLLSQFYTTSKEKKPFRMDFSCSFPQFAVKRWRKQVEDVSLYRPVCALLLFIIKFISEQDVMKRQIRYFQWGLFWVSMTMLSEVIHVINCFDLSALDAFTFFILHSPLLDLL